MLPIQRSESLGGAHFAAWFVITLIAMLLNGTLVPFMVTAPTVQVYLPSDIVLDPDEGG